MPLCVRIHQSDAIDLCEAQDDASVDVIITDPPYWTLDRWRNVGTTTRFGVDIQFFDRVVTSDLP